MRGMAHRLSRRLKLNNDGSALVTVVVVTVFLSIIATTVIYIASRNYLIKANDYQNKKTFYQAETALDEFKGALAADVSAAYKFAYREVMADYANLDASQRDEKYKKAFFDYLYYSWTGATLYSTTIPSDVHPHTGADVSMYDAALGYADSCITDATALDNFRNSFMKASDLSSGDGLMQAAKDDSNLGRFIIKNIRVWYTEDGYTSYICTDIALDPPAYEFGLDNSEGGGDTAVDADELQLHMSDYIIYMNWSKY